MPAAVILAAGAGTRFASGDPGATPGAKLLRVVRGHPLVLWSILPALAAGLDEVAVVGGAADLSTVVPPGVTLLENPRWASGQASSLRVALAWCEQRGHRQAVIGLGDTPGLTAQAWRAVADAPDGAIIFATYDGRRGHPVRLDAEVWGLVAATGDEGARSVARAHPELVVQVACDGDPTDVDTVADLERWESQWS